MTTGTKERITTEDVATVNVGEQLVTAGRTPEALQVAEGYQANDARGKENIDSTDVTLPFLGLAQKTSPQIEPSDAKYIDGLQVGDFFNSLTGEQYGAGPIEFIPIVLKKHAIEFNPFEEGGGIKDRSVPWDDDRCQFHGDEKPTATRFYDWAVLLVPSMELIVLSFKSTNISVAKAFQQIINVRPGPAFAGKYKLVSKDGQAKVGTRTIVFKKFSITPAGKPDADQAQFAEGVFESLKGKNIQVDHVAEPEVTSAEVPPSTSGATSDDIPF